MSAKREAIAALLLVAATSCAVGEDNPGGLVPDENTAVLRLDIELTGSATHRYSNGVEWAALTTKRRLSIDVAMFDTGDGRFPTLAIGGVAAGPPPTEVETPPALAELEQAVETCGENVVCRLSAVTKFSAQIQGQPEAFGLGGEEAPARYQNWTADVRTVDCMAGSIDVHDVGEGVVINPPSPAVSYRFYRDGRFVLDGTQSQRQIELGCQGQVTWDKQANLVSLKLPAAGLSVPVTLSGQAFTNETAVSFMSGELISVLDQPVSETGIWHGEAMIREAGFVSHNSDQVVIPVDAHIKWTFLRQL